MTIAEEGVESLPRNPFRLGGRSPHTKSLFTGPCSDEMKKMLKDTDRRTSVDQPLMIHDHFAKQNARVLTKCNMEDYVEWIDDNKDMYTMHKTVMRNKPKVTPPVRSSSLRKSESPILKYNGSTGSQSVDGSRFSSDVESICSTNSGTAQPFYFDEEAVPTAEYSTKPAAKRSNGLSFPPPLRHCSSDLPPPPASLKTNAATSNDRAEIYEALNALDDALDSVSLRSYVSQTSSGIHSQSSCGSISSYEHAYSDHGVTVTPPPSATPPLATVVSTPPATLRKPSFNGTSSSNRPEAFRSNSSSSNYPVIPIPTNGAASVFGAESTLPENLSPTVSTASFSFAVPPTNGDLPLPPSSDFNNFQESNDITFTPPPPPPPPVFSTLPASPTSTPPATLPKSQKGAPSLNTNVTTLTGFQEIPDNCPAWKISMLEKKNQTLLESEYARLQDAEAETLKWKGIPDWKKKLQLEKQKKNDEKMIPDTIARQKKKVDDEKFKAMPEWKQHLLNKKST